jgi:outer membrane protein assembly factor BamB
MRPPLILVFLALLAPILSAVEPAGAIKHAAEHPGLAVVIGSSDGAVELALVKAGDGKVLVHGLAADAAARDRARNAIRAAGEYGMASVEALPDPRRLPYAENLVTLVVADLDSAPGVTADEITRVLRPGGVAWVRQKGAWTALPAKPRPAGMGIWTHQRFDHTGNAVSDDRLVGPANTIRWLDGYAGASMHMAQGPQAVVGPDDLVSDCRAMSKELGSVRLIDRDPFSGLVRWATPVRWRSGLNAHALDGDVLVTNLSGNDHPVSVDLRTGKKLAAIDQVGSADKGTVRDLRTFVVKNGTVYRTFGRVAIAADERTGAVRWRHESATGELRWPTLSGDGKRLVAVEATELDGSRWPAAIAQAMVCLDAVTGAQIWRRELPPGTGATFLSISGDDILIHTTTGIHALRSDKGNDGPYNATLVSLKDGAVRWTANFLDPATGKATVLAQVGFIRGDEVIVGNWVGNRATGAMLRQFNLAVHNWRCVRATATTNWLLMGFGVFLDKDGRYVNQNISRSGCATGTVPANGMTYQTANACGCFSMIRGTAAFSSEALLPVLSDAARLEGKAPAGPAVPFADRPEAPTTQIGRKDAKVPNMIRTPLISERPVADSWSNNQSLPYPETAPVTAGDLTLVSVVNEHRLEARRGNKVVWTLTADARISASPVVVGNTVYIASHDGWVYAVDLATGERRWRSLIAPNHRRMVAYGGLESAWPVYGVVVHNGLICASAGRHPELDGGIHLAGLDPATGAARWRQVIATDTANTWMRVGDRGVKAKDRYVNRTINGVLRVENDALMLGETVINPTVK